MHGRPTGLFITASPLAGLLLPLPAPGLPLPLQLLMASEQLAPQQGNGASRTGPGVHTGTKGGHF
jgi:hypothetical protein